MKYDSIFKCDVIKSIMTSYLVRYQFYIKNSIKSFSVKTFRSNELLANFLRQLKNDILMRNSKSKLPLRRQKKSTFSEFFSHSLAAGPITFKNNPPPGFWGFDLLKVYRKDLFSVATFLSLANGLRAKNATWPPSACMVWLD